MAMHQKGVQQQGQGGCRRQWVARQEELGCVPSTIIPYSIKSNT